MRNPVDATSSERTRAGASDNYARPQWLRALDILTNLYVRKEVFDPENVIRKVFKNMGVEFSDLALEGFKHPSQYTGTKGVSADKASKVSSGSFEVFFADDVSRNEDYRVLDKFILGALQSSE